MNKLSKICYRCFYLIFGLIFSWFFLYGVGKAKENVVIVLFLEAVLIGIGYLIYSLFQRLPIKFFITLKKWRFILIILFFSLQVVFTLIFRTENTYGWDFDTVVYLAKCYVNNIDVDYLYLASYSTNILYFWFVVANFLVSKFIFGECYVQLLLITNIIFLDVSLYYVYKIVNILHGFRVALFTLLLCIFFTPFWIYLPIAYQDIFSIPLMLLPVYLSLKYKNTKKVLFIIWPLIGIFGAVGFYFKGNTTIAFIALAVFVLLSDSRIVTKLQKIVLMLVGFVVTFLAIKFAFSQMTIITEEEVYENKIPLTQLIYMSFVDNGSWDADIVHQTTQIKGYDEKLHFTIEKIREKFSEYGVVGLFWQISKKESIVMLDVGTLNADRHVVRDPKHVRFVNWILNDDSLINKIYRYYSQSYWRALLILVIIQIWASIKCVSPNDSKHVLNIILFGTILLFMFWETNSRYLVNTASIFIILGTITYSSFYKMLNCKCYDH